MRLLSVAVAISSGLFGPRAVTDADPRTPSLIAIDRAREIFKIVIFPMIIGALLSPLIDALGSLASDLGACQKTPHACVIHWDPWLSAMYGFLKALVLSGAVAIGNYRSALNTARKNVRQTGTTAPLSTVRAPEIALAQDGQTLIVAAHQPTPDQTAGGTAGV